MLVARPLSIRSFGSVLLALYLGLLDLLLEQHILEFVCQANGMLWTLRLANMNISTATSSNMEILALNAWSECNLGDGDLVLAGSGLDLGGSNVGCSTSTSTEGTVTMVTDNSFADDLSITISIKPSALSQASYFGWNIRANERSMILANVSSTYE